jgi:hypothetical protein
MTDYELPQDAPFSLRETDLVNLLLPDAVILLENDFRTSGIELNVSGKIFGDVFDLRDVVAKAIAETGGPGSEIFYRLLYRIDIPESRTKELLNSPAGKPLEELIAEAIIVRELQKAFYRRKFQS